MKRRKFGLMAGCGAAALGSAIGLPNRARGAVTVDQAATLKTTLTPLGAERAGNADGSIPAWTGGLTQPPAGWTPTQPMPDIFADEKPIVTIDAGNMEQYKDRLAEGIMLKMKNDGFSIKVYPTHRTAAAPQRVYDNTYQNALTAQPVPGGARLGFTDAFGGTPFPIPNPTDANEAGGEIIWNHLTRWLGNHLIYNFTFYSVTQTGLTLLFYANYWLTYPYYGPNGTVATFDGFVAKESEYGLAPANQMGTEVVAWPSANPTRQASEGWQFLSGQGRVRKLPEVEYDIPEPATDGITVYDEVQCFYGSPDRFDWKLLGKKEMYIPYNTNRVAFLQTTDYMRNFINPEMVRWELHRVWVVEATVHPGDRNIIPHRVFYIDEDTWTASIVDEYDAQGNYWALNLNHIDARPDVPGAIATSSVLYNLQQESYVHQNAQNATVPLNERVFDYTTVPNPSLFNPQTMAARAQF
jgi:hypothetical protein